MVRDPQFPQNPKEAIMNGFLEAEKSFLMLVEKEAEMHSIAPDKSGSCASVVMFIDDICYTVNVGDSRALLSTSSGRRVYAISRDHRPGDEIETKRITEAGGKIY